MRRLDPNSVEPSTRSLTKCNLLIVLMFCFYFDSSLVGGHHLRSFYPVLTMG